MTAAETFYIAGDICPTVANEALFTSGDARTLVGPELLRRFRESRGLVFNLEVALTDVPSPIVKSGPCLTASEDCVSALAAMNPICACLANNHIVDSGSDGFRRTVAALEGAGIHHCGAGYSLGKMPKHHLFEMGGKCYAVYACAEHEFTICEGDKPGANPFDPSRTYDDIKDLASRVDSVIVLYHGMKEHYRYPSPEVRERCRRMVEAGAMLVCCQHSHCVGCVERVGESTIVYGQGNFCFVNEEANEMWRVGLVVSVSSEGIIELLPVRAGEVGVELLEGDEAFKVIADLEKRSNEILQPGFVESSWSAFCAGIVDGYVDQLLCAVEPRWIALMIRVLRKLRLCKPELAVGSRSAGFLNMLQCEAHNEVLRTYLKENLDA